MGVTMKLKTLACVMIAMLSVQTLFAADAETKAPERTRISYSEFRQFIDAGEVVDAKIWDSGWWVTGTLSDGSKFGTSLNPSTHIADRLVDAGVSTKFVISPPDDEETRPLYLKIFYIILPLLIFLGFLLFMMRGANRNIWKKNEEHLDKAERINNEQLDRLEILQREFFARLEKVLSERKQK